MPPAALVASTSTSDPASAPVTLSMGITTPVEVSLCVRAYASMPASACGNGWVPGSEAMTLGSASHGAVFVTLANLVENSPQLTSCPLPQTSPTPPTTPNPALPPLP